MKLNPRQKLFAENYCGKHLGNAEQSAIAAGYSAAYARGNACKLLANSGVQAYIAEITAKTESETVATIADIKAFWTNIMNDESQMVKNRLKASELLAKSSGMFTSEW